MVSPVPRRTAPACTRAHCAGRDTFKAWLCRPRLRQRRPPSISRAGAGAWTNLEKLAQTLEDMAAQCDGGAVPACPIVDALLESA
jgi:hypothetical protein